MSVITEMSWSTSSDAFGKIGLIAEPRTELGVRFGVRAFGSGSRTEYGHLYLECCCYKFVKVNDGMGMQQRVKKVVCIKTRLMDSAKQ